MSSASSDVYLPDGQTYTVQPVFGGLFFKSLDMMKHRPLSFPVGWTVVIHTEEEGSQHAMAVDQPGHANSSRKTASPSHGLGDLAPISRCHSFTKPTLQNDSLFISSMSHPSSADYSPPASPTRQIAMMLWVTLYWYFHQPRPATTLPSTEHSRLTVPEGRPRGDWRVNIHRDGILRGRNLMPKLERMGLIASLDSAVGSSLDDKGDEWAHMFVSQRIFWQLPGRLFLFSPRPVHQGASSQPVSPVSSRPDTPAAVKQWTENGNHPPLSPPFHLSADVPGGMPSQSTQPASLGFPMGPFSSSAHLPTYYPPPPLQYTFSNHTWHPVRPKPPRMGEVFYTRFVPSVGKYLSLRVASSSPLSVPYLGPVSPSSQQQPDGSNGAPGGSQLLTKCDRELVQMWLSNPRVAKFWGGPTPTFLADALESQHSFPVIGLWDGVPFGYFEIYWVKEDILGRYAQADDFDRGIHVFVGEEWARGRVSSWLGALVHWIFASDNRTMNVCIEPRVDNKRFIQHLQQGGFVGQKEITFPHKQSWFGRLPRETWEGPSL